MVGYQGESARPVSQRHSASLFRDPDRRGQRPRQMGDRGVAGDNEIECGHSRRRVDERVRPGVEIRPERLDPHRRRHKRELLFADALLQGNEPDARDLGKRRQGQKRHRPGAIGLRIGVALSCNADLEAGGADAPSPHFA
jgi:hypothetical protein